MSAGIFGVRSRRRRANKLQLNVFERAHGETAEKAAKVIVLSRPLQNTKGVCGLRYEAANPSPDQDEWFDLRPETPRDGLEPNQGAKSGDRI